jgi:integrase/recombinase XerC
MTYQEMIRQYKEGERTCGVCGELLPAHETIPGARFRFCGKPQCAAILRTGKRGRYVGPNQLKCEGPGCNNFIPEGRYDLRADYLACCGECWVRRRTKGNRLLTCGCGCGQEFLGRAERKPTNGLYFLSLKHYGTYQKEQYLVSSSGPLLPIVREFLEGFAALHYGEHYTLRKSIGPFFEYLKIEGITSVEDVTPKTITAYLAWGKKTDRRSVAKSPSFISTFFKWAIASGYRKYGNPVVPLIHRPRNQRRMPRPLEVKQLEFMWRLLHERGNARLRLAAAIAEEAGLRLGEICRLRLQDIDLTRQRLFIRLPNKGKQERYAFFSEKTKLYYDEWMAERDLRSKHDRILHNVRLDPCTVQSLGKEFSRVLCKTYLGKPRNEEGWEKWSTHALRHTMASNLVSAGADAATVMAAGGWKTYEAVCGYAHVDGEVARRGYEEAMKRVHQQKQQAPRKKALSLTDFLELKRKRS